MKKIHFKEVQPNNNKPMKSNLKMKKISDCMMTQIDQHKRKKEKIQ